MQTRTYYEILDIPQDATLDVIKKKYRELAKKYHPDKNKDADAAEEFKAISGAYEILSDPDKRASYDMQLRGGRSFSDYSASFHARWEPTPPPPPRKTVDDFINDIKNLAENNKAAELRAYLVAHLKTKLSGESIWDYATEKKWVESVARDAILAGHDEILQVLLEAGLSPDDEPPNDNPHYDDLESRFEKKLIQYAVESGRLSTVKLLVEYGAKIYMTGHEYFSNGFEADTEERRVALALRTAIHTRNAAIVEYLLECGADPNGLYYGSHGDGTTYLAKAADDGNFAIIKSLIKHGVDITMNIMRTHRSRDHLGLKNSFQHIIKIIMDYAIGCDLTPSKDTVYTGLYFLKDLDVSHMNFIGVSVAGKSVTRALLEKETKSGAKNAIVTLADLKALNDEVRKTRINKRLNAVIIKKGCLSRDIGWFLAKEQGILNLAPLTWAAASGDTAAVRTRIQAGEDPNVEDKKYDFVGNGFPLVLAAQNGHLEIVKMLAAAHDNHTANKARQLIKAAKEFVSHHPDVKSLSVINGQLRQLHPISLPMVSEKCLMIVPEDKKFADAMYLIRHVGLETLRDTIQTNIPNLEKYTHNFIISPVIMRNWEITFTCFLSSGLEDCERAISKIMEMDHPPPVIFINNNNFDFIEALVIAQYREMDKAKEITTKAIEAAKEQGHQAVVSYLEKREESKQEAQKKMIAELVRQRSNLHGTAVVTNQDKEGLEPKQPSMKNYSASI